MKRLLAMIAALSSSQAAAQGFACNEWSVPGYGEGGALVVIMTDDQLTWSNGTVTSDARFIYSGRTESTRVYASGNTLYLVSGLSAVEIRRVHMDSAERDSVTLCTRAE